MRNRCMQTQQGLVSYGVVCPTRIDLRPANTLFLRMIARQSFCDSRSAEREVDEASNSHNPHRLRGESAQPRKRDGRGWV